MKLNKIRRVLGVGMLCFVGACVWSAQSGLVGLRFILGVIVAFTIQVFVLTAIWLMLGDA